MHAVVADSSSGYHAWYRPVRYDIGVHTHLDGPCPVVDHSPVGTYPGRMQNYHSSHPDHTGRLGMSLTDHMLAGGDRAHAGGAVDAAVVGDSTVWRVPDRHSEGRTPC